MSDSARTANLISPVDLRAALAAGQDVVLLDVRHNPVTDTADAQAFRAGHLPGAQFVGVDEALAGTSTGVNGARPLPEPDGLEKRIRGWGLYTGTPVVVYGATRSPAPARAWWVLRWAGVESVRLLDGGLDGWTRHGGVLSTAETACPETGFVIRSGGLPVIEASEVPDVAARGELLDARPATKFAGSADPGVGHIPGARNVPLTELFDAAGYLKDEAELRAVFGIRGIAGGSSPATYCGSGVAAALEVLALALLDIPARLYVGSLSEWTADPARRLDR